MAEKRSTPKRHTAKKVEESKPASEIQQAVEPVKLREINWDVVGLSSVAIPLVGAGFLFIIGWAYESNWYEYFGIDVSQLDISLQQYLVHSVIGLALSLSLLLIGTFLYLFVKMAFITILSISTKQGRDFSVSRSDWFGITIFYIVEVVRNLFPDGITSAYQRPIEIQILIFLSQAAAAVLSISLTGVIIVYSVRRTLYRRFSDSQLTPTQLTKPSLSTQVAHFLKLLNSPSILIVYFCVFLFSSMSLASSMAITHASAGSKLSLLSVQKVYLVGYKALPSLQVIQDINESCDKEGSCFYGPFGLVAENANSFYLIVWRENKIPFRPGLFIFPRNDQNGPYLIIPVLAISAHPASTPIATLDILPTLSPTITPTLGPTISPSTTLTSSQP
jgi:hypothetical protein